MEQFHDTACKRSWYSHIGRFWPISFLDYSTNRWLPLWTRNVLESWIRFTGLYQTILWWK